MGLMDNIKNSQDMAKQAQEAAAAQGANPTPPPGVSVPGGIEYGQWMQRMAMEGEDATGTITSITETGNEDAGAKEFEVKIDANKDGEDYEATAKQFLHPDAVSSYAVGKKFDLKADPEDKTRVLLMGGLD